MEAATPGLGLSFLAVTGGVALGNYLFLKYQVSSIAKSLGGDLMSPTHPKYQTVTSTVASVCVLVSILTIKVAQNAELGVVPPVYLIPTQEQNAFAVGFNKNSYAIGITEGLLNNLTTKELAAVIGHEVGHMKNGDTSTNMHLIAINAGFYFSYWLGRQMLRNSGDNNNNKNNSKGKNNMQLLGVGLAAVGLTTYLLGNFFRLAISRRREYEADASSVAFVGDNLALASALKKITAGIVPTGTNAASAVATPLREGHDLYGHMFIASAIQKTSAWDSFLTLFSTHPPMSKRIEQLEQMGDLQLQANQAKIGPVSRPLIVKK